MISIQRRLGVGLLLIVMCVGLSALLATSWLLDAGVRRYLAEHLRSEAEALLIAIDKSADGLGPELNPNKIAPRYQQPLSGAYFHIAAGQKQWRSRSLWDHPLNTQLPQGLASALQEGPNAQHLLTYQGHYQRAGAPIVITVALDYSPIEQTLRLVYGVLLGLGAGALLILLLLQRRTIKQALKPLEQAHAQLAQLQRGERARLDMPAPVELTPLLGQINQLLSHTESSLKRSRSALGNLGHALKTPISVLRVLLARQAGAVAPNDHQQVLAQLEEMERCMVRELKRARLAGEVLPGAQFDCQADLAALCDTLKMIHPKVQITQAVAPTALRLPWEREDVLEVLGNLLDNACKWARKDVRIHIHKQAQCYQITVEDDGPGVAQELWDTLLTRGTRLDEQTPGHGLGLSIVRDTVEAWGGKLVLGQSQMGGLSVHISLEHGV